MMERAMRHLDDKMIAALEAVLLKQRNALAGAVRARLHADGADAARALENDYAQADPAQADALGESGLALLHQDCRQLEAVEQALARLADGSYGLCRACGLPIAPARLQARPAAALCLDCQQDSERRYQVPPA